MKKYKNGDKLRDCVFIEYYKKNSIKSFASFKCICGNEFVGRIDAVSSGTKTGCGCNRFTKNRLNPSRRTHGLSNSPEYKVWCTMRNRCNNPKVKSYKDYGGRGITVCERWNESFENFISDMGMRPSKNHSIDRQDFNGHYEPNNCIWATPEVQRRNRRDLVIVIFRGKERLLFELAVEYGIRGNMIRKRLKRGWSVEQAVTLKSENKRLNMRTIPSKINYAFGHVA